MNRLPEPRFAVIVSHYSAPGREDNIEYKWHRNHRLYETAGIAGGYAKQYCGSRNRASAFAIVVDPQLCEPANPTAHEAFEFAERMAQYWTEQMSIRRDAVSTEGPAKPRPKRRANAIVTAEQELTQQNAKARRRAADGRIGSDPARDRRRRRRQAQAASPSLASTALVAAAAGFVGQAIANAITTPTERPFAPITPPALPEPPVPPKPPRSPRPPDIGDRFLSFPFNKDKP